MEESNEKNTGGTVCPKCGLRISRPGTVTAWIFQTGYCQCKKGDSKGESSNPAPTSNQQDTAKQPLLGNRYKVLNPLGRGGVANVYKVQDSVTMEILAAKVMLTELALNDLAVKRFQKEVDVLADLTHPNLVKIHGYAMDRNGIPYLIMDYVEGPNLEDLIKFAGPLDADVNRAVNLFIQICTGLKCVHDIGIIHRDLKPSNIIVSSKEGSNSADHVTIIDFGFAKLVDSARESRLTTTGEAFGSPSYMSPEHCLGQELDARSDIYSFGCLMYQVLCGKPPIEGENALATVAKQVKGDVTSPRSINPNVPKNLDTVIMKCLEKEPSMRYQSVGEIEGDLVRVLSGKHVSAQVPRERSTEARSWSQNSQHVLLNRWVAIAAIVLLVLGSGLIGAWIASNSASKVSSSNESIPQAVKPKPSASFDASEEVDRQAPSAQPQVKTTIDQPPRTEKTVPAVRHQKQPTAAVKHPPKKLPVRTVASPKTEKKRSEDTGSSWQELKKLRKFN